MNFMEAVKAMKEGKKVRRNYWKTQYIVYKEDFFYWDDGGADKRLVMSGELIEATDWEIYEEEDNWNLADKLVKIKCDDYEYVYNPLDIKTFIQKVKEDDDGSRETVQAGGDADKSPEYIKGYLTAMGDTDYHRKNRAGDLK